MKFLIFDKIQLKMNKIPKNGTNYIHNFKSWYENMICSENKSF